MKITQLKVGMMVVYLAVLSMMFTPDTNAQAGTRAKASLSKSQRTLIIDSILSADLEKIKSLASQQPQLAPGIAGLYAKHSGARGKEAGKIAAELALAIDADAAEAAEIVASVSQKTTASLDEVTEIVGAIIESGLPIF